MKNVSVVLISAISLSAFSFANGLNAADNALDKDLNPSINKDSSWQTIIDSRTYVVEDKKISFSGTMVHVLDTCMLDQNTIRSSKKITRYEWSDKQSHGKGPAAVDKIFLTTEKVTTKSYSDYDKSISQEEVRDTQYKLSVFYRDAHESAAPAFVKNYSIPNC